MKVAAIHQPNYLPWLGYFYKISKCDIFVFLDNVQYTKNSFINRNKIKTSQGPAWLTVGTLTKGNPTQTIREVKINNSNRWNQKHWISICQSYARSPYLSEYRDQLEVIYQRTWEHLADLNRSLILICCNMLGITGVEFVKASDLNVSGASSALLIDICKEVDADIYLSGFGGANYIDQAQFRDSGIELRYYDFQHPNYRQLWGIFVPNLSILDLIFNEGSKSLQILKGKYRQIGDQF